MEQTTNTQTATPTPRPDFAKVNGIAAAAVYEYATGRGTGGGHFNCPLCGSRDNMTINPRTNHFHCFGANCGANLSNIDYFAAVTGTDAKTAAARLSDYFFCKGIDAPRFEPPQSSDTPTAPTYTQKHDAAVDAYVLELLRAADGDNGLNLYLDGRGFTRDIRRRADIYTISRADYYKINTKLKKEFGDRLNGVAGISAAGNFIFAAHRIIFAVRDARGRLTGFKGRAMPNSDDEKNGRKYLNAAPRDGYNLCAAVEPTAARLYIVEGELDAVAADAVGLSAVSFGGLTGGQATAMQRRLFKYCADRGTAVTLLFDADRAGQTAADNFDAIAKDFPTLTATAADVREVAKMYLPDRDPDTIAKIKDFGDILRHLNGDKMTDSHRAANIATAEKYCSAGAYDIDDIAAASDSYPFEVRRGFMDLIALYGCKFLTFTDDFARVKVEY